MGIPGPFVQFSHIATEAPEFMFTVDGNVPEKMTRALEIPPRFLRYDSAPWVTRYRRRLLIYGGHPNGSYH
jgi:hypothetical protein